MNSQNVSTQVNSCNSKTDRDPICEFYTEHPYPPPVENLDRARDEWEDGNRRRAEYHLFWPDQKFHEDLNILVAGCGTWQAAKYAICHPNARVTGVDVSTTSLEHTEQLKQKHNLTNLELEQMAIERIADLDEKFDLVVCTGVLHHLINPDIGLQALREVLKQNGALYLMVYAPYGRSGVYLIQEYCRRLGIGTSVKEINDLATVVETLPPQHPLATLLRSSRDALTAEALADALLNPRDRSYSVPQLFDLIDNHNLSLARWYWRAPYDPQCGAIASTPHAKRLAGMSEREQYAALELLRGMMTTHSVILQRQDKSRSRVLDEHDLTDSIPLRLPNTLCIGERLPPGVAAALLNQSHQFHDLILMIKQYEKEMFEAIDGKRSVREIAELVGPKTSGVETNKFFWQLWSYDQVVFDASSVIGARS